MLSRQAFWRNSCAAATVGLALAGVNSAANATVPGYCTTGDILPFLLFPPAPIGLQADVRPRPLVLAAAETAPEAGNVPTAGEPNATNPGAPNAATAAAPNAAMAGAPSPGMNVTPSLSANPDSFFPDLGSILAEAAEENAPAWQFGAHVGLEEIATDNVRHTATDHQADLISQLSAGVSVSGTTPRLQALLSYTAVARRALNANQQNRISHLGTATSHLTLYPDLFFLDLRGNAQEVVRQGFGAPNPALLTNSEVTQVFLFSATPNFRSRVGSIGFLNVQYSYSELWRDKNTGSIATANGTLAPFSGAKTQLVRTEFQMPGTFSARMLNEVALRASEIISSKIGTLRKAGGDFITEYQLTRSFSGIADGGYEALSAPNVPGANGEAPTWGVGGRWRPNVDSSFLLLYGSRDLKTDVAGEIAWRLTPLTMFYAAYTDSLTSSQQMLLGGNAGSFLDQDGPEVGVTFDDNPIIGVLGGGTSGGIGGGFPFADSSNLLAQQNGLFRHKFLRGTLTSDIGGDHVSWIADYSQAIPLTAGTIMDRTSYGTRLSWIHGITQNINGRVEVDYRSSIPSNSKTYNLALSAGYRLSQTLDSSLRYDLLRRESNKNSFYVNALTLRLRKLF